MTAFAHPAAPPDRRPIRSRSTRWANAVARLLVRLRVSPNAISLVGLACALAACALLAVTARHPDPPLFLAAAALLLLRLLANMFDGMVALARGRPNPLGELFNEVPDRLSDAAALIGAGLAAGGSLTLGLVAALLAVFTAYLRAALRATGAPSDFRGPMAKPHRMWLLIAACLAAAAAHSPWARHFDPANALRLPVGIIDLALALIILGCVVTCARRLLAGARAMREPPR